MRRDAAASPRTRFSVDGSVSALTVFSPAELSSEVMMSATELTRFASPVTATATPDARCAGRISAWPCCAGTGASPVRCGVFCATCTGEDDTGEGACVPVTGEGACAPTGASDDDDVADCGTPCWLNSSTPSFGAGADAVDAGGSV